MTARVAAVVVTFNRKELLAGCLDALLGQRRPLEKVYVVDNASTDGTREFLEARDYLEDRRVHYARLPENGGGAGGFCAGLRLAMSEECDWFWLLDDDAVPDLDALSMIMDTPPVESNAYASCAVFRGGDGEPILCWSAEVEKGGRVRRIREIRQLPMCASVRSLPFLGFFIARALVQKVGLPDASYFISGDDVDYSHRIREGGGDLVLVRESRISHPRPDDYVVRIPGRRFVCLCLPPWRRYYDIRNRVMNGRRHYGAGLVFMTLPGIAVRWAATMLREPERLRQSRAYLRGTLDGLRGRLGRRWEPGT